MIDLEKVNPGIRRTVALLNANGFQTCDSGDGETHDHPCDRDVGYVVVQVPPAAILVHEADRLMRLLVSHFINVVPVGHDDGVSIQASYDPANGISILDVSNIHDRLFTQPKTAAT